MADFEVSGIAYKSKRMPVRVQFHVARRLAPLLSALQGHVDAGDSLHDVVRRFKSGAEAIGALVPIAQSVASLSDADVDYALDECLKRVERQQVVGGTSGWFPIWEPTRRRFMYDNINFAEMCEIAFWVIWHDILGPVLGDLPVIASAETTASGEQPPAPGHSLAAASGDTPKLGDRDGLGRTFSDGGGLHAPRWLHVDSAA